MSGDKLNELSGYPCSVICGSYMCSESCGCINDCREADVYRAHIALRRAVLGDMTAEEAAHLYRMVSAFYSDRGWGVVAKRLEALADAVAGMAC